MKSDVERSLLTVDAGHDNLRATACFAEDLPVFAGHFPGAPLVPGVFLIEAVRCACERSWGQPLALREIVQARFTGRLLPGERVELEVRWRADGEVRRVDAVLRGPAGEVAELRLRLG